MRIKLNSRYGKKAKRKANTKKLKPIINKTDCM